ncbi:hypothetical protein C8J57DRAFT_1522832 [Mycena rebaudengoi]|nr:hypothetical protein C8J57DRAFT_1522832 [Mycena rebaudengoi]
MHHRCSGGAVQTCIVHDTRPDTHSTVEPPVQPGAQFAPYEFMAHLHNHPIDVIHPYTKGGLHHTLRLTTDALVVPSRPASHATRIQPVQPDPHSTLELPVQPGVQFSPYKSMAHLHNRPIDVIQTDINLLFNMCEPALYIFTPAAHQRATYFDGLMEYHEHLSSTSVDIPEFDAEADNEDWEDMEPGYQSAKALSIQQGPSFPARRNLDISIHIMRTRQSDTKGREFKSGSVSFCIQR